MKEMEKRGQVAIYVIIAIVIVVLGVLVYFFRSDIGTIFGGELVPNSFLASCLEEDVRNGIKTLSMQGGYSNPEGYIMYQGSNIKYLCYNAGYYKPCQVQQPMIKSNFENELNEIVTNKARECANNLKKAYEDRGFEVTGFSTATSKVEIVPGVIRIKVNAPMTVTKDTTQTFTEFDARYKSEMYDLLMISTSIIDYESTYGNSETTFYYQYYPNLRIEKLKLGEGSTIYTVSDVRTEEEFTFASRSLAWPGGIGLEA